VATENNSVYALDAASAAVVWHASAGSPVPADQLPCGDIQPTVGITSTPVIDPAAGKLYAVADTLERVGPGLDQPQLVAFDLASGAASSPAPVD
jgi:outer membrane protein assembly factor BamB